jgi:Subtilase family/Fibronectin type III domain
MFARARFLAAAILAVLITAGVMPSQAFAAVLRTTYIVQTTAAGQDSVLKSLFGMGEVPLDQLDFVMDGFTVPLTEFEASVLAADPDVISVQPDQQMSLLETETPVPSWGLDRIDQQTNVLDNSFSYPADGGKGVRVYVVDTGVMASNPEFDGRILTGFDALGQNLQGQDCHGHGTHVAGTVAGTKYGVAKAATIVPVRVLGCDGRGYTSVILTALDWILANNPAGTPAVMSMSIGGGSQPLFNAGIKKLYDGGILPIVAAGNSNDDACKYSPSGTPDALTVGASDPTDTRAYFSNYGDCVDIFAPGTNIISAKASDPAATATMSGTSMATPHVSGVAALYLAQHPTARPAEVAKALKDNGILNALNNAQSQFGNILLNDNFVRGAAPIAPNPNPLVNAPDPVVSLNVTNIASNGATINWVDGASDGGSPIKGHIILARAPGDIYATSWNAIGQTLNSYAITGLSANTNYSFSIYPYNAIGSGRTSSIVTAKTLVGAPTAPGKPVVVASSSTASVSWATANNGGSPITGYTVEMYSASAPRWAVVATTTATSATLTGLVSGTTYIVRVRATSALGTSYPSGSVSFTTAAGVPDVPTLLASSGITTNSAVLSWKAVNSTSPTTPIAYVVSYAIDGSTTKSQIASSTPNVQLSALLPGRTYTFTVHSQVGEVVSAESTASSFTTLATLPGAPTSVTVTGVPGSQVMRWQSPADNGGSAILGYIVQVSEVLASTTAPVTSWTTFAEQTANSISLPAAPVTKYVRYRVVAKNAIGLSEPSLSIATYSAPAKPSAPTNLAASAPNSSGLITLTWSAPASDGGAAITQYSVLISRDGTTWSTLANLVPSATLSYSTAKPTKGQTWSYAVAARNVSGLSVNSNAVAVSTQTTVPSAVSTPKLALTGTTGIQLSWNAPGDNGGSVITGYTVERQVAGVWSQVAQVSGTTLSLTATRSDLGQLNTFRVTAQNAIGSGAASAAVSLLTPFGQASAPQNFAATLNTATKRVDVSYVAPTYLGGGAVQAYLIQASKDGGATWSTLVSTAATNLATSVSAPSKGQTWTYRVLASTQAGASVPSSLVSISVATTVPGAVQSPSAILSGTADVTVRWAVPSDNGGLTLTGFLVERLIDGAWVTAAQLPATSFTFTSPRALPGVLNAFRITTANSLGNSPASQAVSVLTPYVAATAPQNFTAVYNASTQRVSVAFTAPTYLGGGTVNFYSLQTSVDGTTWTSVANLTGSSFTYSAPAPAKGTTRSYRVSAVTQFGYGAPSNVVAVSVALTVPSAPNFSSIAYTSDGSVSISWFNPENGGTAITGYKLQKLDSSNNWIDALTVGGSALNAVVARDLPGTKVTWRVIAINSVGASLPSAVASYVIPAVKASAVQNVAVTATTSAATVLVSFVAPSNLGGSALSSYQVQVSRDGGATWVATATTRNLTIAVAAPAKGVTWSYRVVASTSVGLGDASASVSYTGK